MTLTAPRDLRGTARSAPLGQLSARELEGGILAVDTAGSRWLFDLGRCRFQQLAPGADVAQARTFGEWHPYRTLHAEPGALVVVPDDGRAPVRIRLGSEPEPQPEPVS